MKQRNYTPTTGVEVLLECSKSYWKVRANIDVLIVCHTASQCIEIIMFDPERNLEANRLYLNSVLLAGKVDQKEIQAKLAEKKESYTRQKKLFSAPQVTKELMTQAMLNFIQIRLQISVLTEREFIVTLANMSDADVITQNGLLDVVYPNKPQTVTPLECQFVKKFKSVDVNYTLNHLKHEEEVLKSATKLAELATVEEFASVISEKLRVERKMRSMYTPARWRWIRAINRVLVRNYVARIRKRVIAMGIYKEPSEVANEPLEVDAIVNEPQPLGISKVAMRFLTGVLPIHFPLPSRANFHLLSRNQSTENSVSINTVSGTSSKSTSRSSISGTSSGNISTLNSSSTVSSCISPRSTNAMQLKTLSASPSHRSLPTVRSPSVRSPSIRSPLNSAREGYDSNSNSTKSRLPPVKRGDATIITNKVDAIRMRRAMNSDVYGTVIIDNSRPTSPSPIPTNQFPNGTIPSLAQSYSVISQKEDLISPRIVLYDLTNTN